MDSSVLIQPVKLGDLTLKNKICMSALTRMRSDKGVPN